MPETPVVGVFTPELPLLELDAPVLYRLLATIVKLLARSGRNQALEIIVLRHQLMVLRRQIDRPALTETARSLLGAIAAALPRARRAGWLVGHARHAAALAPSPHHPPLDPATSSTEPAWHRHGRPSAGGAHGSREPDLGYRRIHGELIGLGHIIGASTVW